jgi:hypothetical protein
MSLALQRTLGLAPSRPEAPAPPDREARLNIDVVFTSVEATLVALKKAAELANRLGARITLVVPQVVPYPLPLESPPVLLDWNERRFRVIAEQSPVETTVHLYLCRDRVQMLRDALRPHSLVVLGGRKRWWPTAEDRLARELRRQGHEVILAETK